MNPIWPLLRVEFTVPRTVTSRAVRSYRRPFTPYLIPLARTIGSLLSVALVGRFPQALPGTLPYGPGLSSPPPVSPKGTTTKRRLSGVSFARAV